MNDTSLHMHDLTVAAHQLVTDWADVRVRGYLKEHPDVVDYRLTMLEEALAAVRQQVKVERAAGSWSGRITDPDADFNGEAMDFVEHTCNCEWCLCGGKAGAPSQPIVLTTIPAANLVGTCPECGAAPGTPCHDDGIQRPDTSPAHTARYTEAHGGTR